MRVRPPYFLAVVLLAGATAACASGSASRAATADPMANVPTTTRIESMAGTAEVRSYATSAATSEGTVPAAAAKAFTALPSVYEALGVPVNTILSDAATFGVRDMRMPRRLGKTSLSQYVDCGVGPTGSPNADVYAVTMSVLSRLTPATDASKSIVSTQLSATARPITVSGNSVQCASTGRLEAAINGRLALEAAR